MTGMFAVHRPARELWLSIGVDHRRQVPRGLDLVDQPRGVERRDRRVDSGCSATSLQLSTAVISP